MTMNKKMLVEYDPHETRVAILEQDRLAELFIERHHQLGVVGNVYLGRVNRVLPGMQAAFVNIGLERDAFLYVSEVVDPLATYDEVIEARESSPDENGAPGIAAAGPDDDGLVGVPAFDGEPDPEQSLHGDLGAAATGGRWGSVGYLRAPWPRRSSSRRSVSPRWTWCTDASPSA